MRNNIIVVIACIVDKYKVLCYNINNLLIKFGNIRVGVFMDVKEFVQEKQAMHHKIKEFKLFDLSYGETVLCSVVYADYTDETVVAENYTENLVKTALGPIKEFTWQQFNDFLEERCIPYSRAGLREYLAVYKIAEFDPLAIIEKTQGRMAEDNQWLEVQDL